ncbi:unnamed protein product [Heligmosomoides polygyrus]|uniref:Uncharacterized protein n=1 Tax=Heligmosomoides polygyrus TaxID=6339 RepID=A0A183FTP5_HELPZ|nr:unnamed protein product [Heligmosomoides polygyrus]
MGSVGSDDVLYDRREASVATRRCRFSRSAAAVDMADNRFYKCAAAAAAACATLRYTRQKPTQTEDERGLWTSRLRSQGQLGSQPASQPAGRETALDIGQTVTSPLSRRRPPVGSVLIDPCTTARCTVFSSISSADSTLFDFVSCVAIVSSGGDSSLQNNHDQITVSERRRLMTTNRTSSSSSSSSTNKKQSSRRLSLTSV